MILKLRKKIGIYQIMMINFKKEIEYCVNQKPKPEAMTLFFTTDLTKDQKATNK